MGKSFHPPKQPHYELIPQSEGDFERLKHMGLGHVFTAQTQPRPYADEPPLGSKGAIRRIGLGFGHYHS